MRALRSLLLGRVITEATKDMSEEAPTLETELLKWSKGNDDAFNHWKAELASPPHFITDLQTLEEMDLESFEVLLGALKARNQAVLIQKLKIWYKEKHPESNFLIKHQIHNFPFCRRFVD